MSIVSQSDFKHQRKVFSAKGLYKYISMPEQFSLVDWLSPILNARTSIETVTYVTIFELDFDIASHQIILFYFSFSFTEKWLKQMLNGKENTKKEKKPMKDRNAWRKNGHVSKKLQESKRSF